MAYRFQNSIRRADFLAGKRIHFIGMGISGGEEGARFGPSLMPGGPRVAYDAVAPIFEKCAAQVEGIGPCVGYLGAVGSGNYVKMVHNGIEYGDMQLIAEVYDTLKLVVGMGNEEMANLFGEWNKTELSSYLIEITATILRKKDDLTGEGYVVDYILDKTGQKVRCLCHRMHVLWTTRQLSYAIPPLESPCAGNRSVDDSRSC